MAHDVYPLDVIAEAYARQHGHAYHILSTTERELYDKAAQEAVDELVSAKIIVPDDEYSYEDVCTQRDDFEKEKNDLVEENVKLTKQIDDLKACLERAANDINNLFEGNKLKITPLRKILSDLEAACL